MRVALACEGLDFSVFDNLKVTEVTAAGKGFCTLLGVDFIFLTAKRSLDEAGPVIWIGGPIAADENGGGWQDAAIKAAPEDKVRLPRKD
jgi:hypothetical protein